MRYDRLRNVIAGVESSEAAFARRCGIEEGYFVRTLDSGADFTGEEYWVMALCLGIASDIEAQDRLFFEDTLPEGVGA